MVIFYGDFVYGVLLMAIFFMVIFYGDCLLCVCFFLNGDILWWFILVLCGNMVK